MAKNKNRIRSSKKSYQVFFDNSDGFDPINPDGIWEGNSPFYIVSANDQISDFYEILEEMYYSKKFKGRQKQVLSLLMDGIFNESEIGRRLKITQNQVSTHLLRIRKKLLKKCGYVC